MAYVRALSTLGHGKASRAAKLFVARCGLASSVGQLSPETIAGRIGGWLLHVRTRRDRLLGSGAREATPEMGVNAKAFIMVSYVFTVLTALVRTSPATMLRRVARLGDVYRS